MIDRVNIETLDGGVWVIHHDEEVTGPDGSVALADLRDHLTDPAAWVEFETVYQRNTENEWDQPNPEEPGRVRLFARAIEAVGEIYRTEEST